MSAIPNHRWKLVLLIAVFAAPVVVAIVLVGLGWRPLAAQNYGELLQPAQDFREVLATGADGKPLPWSTRDGIFHVLVALPDDCGAPCAELADSFQRLWHGMGKRAPRVRFVFAGEADADLLQVAARFPQLDLVTLTPDRLARVPVLSSRAERMSPLPAQIVDPNGYLILRYDAGFDPAGLRRDLNKLIR